MLLTVLNATYAAVGTSAIITTNTPPKGYIPNQVYTINANIQGSNDKHGFEITAEETNFGSEKKGTFFISNITKTKLTNNNKAVTHKLGGIWGASVKIWSMKWEVPITGTGAVTFYGAFIEGNMNQNNSGDIYHSTNLTVNESANNSTNNIAFGNQIIFNSITKTIKSQNNSVFSIYNLK